MASSFTLNNILRYEGRAMLGMIGMMTGAVINIICDPIFMFALDMGIAGAGLATCIGQMLSFIILMYMFIRKRTVTTLSLFMYTRDIKKLANIAATGLPSLLRQGLGSIATIILNMSCAPYGDEAIAAMTIVNRISFLVFAIALGVGQGFQPICGFNYGAGKYSRVRSAFKFTLVLGEAFVLIGGVLIFIFSPDLIRVFRDDDSVVVIGARALRISALSLPFLARHGD